MLQAVPSHCSTSDDDEGPLRKVEVPTATQFVVLVHDMPYSAL
jgi:hypothetical protein